MALRFGSLLLVIAALDACSSSDEVTRARCEQYRDHVIDVRLQHVVDPNAPATPDIPAIDLEAHRRAMKQAIGERFLETCQSRMTIAQLKCGLRARDAAALAACDSPSTTD